MQQDQNSPDNAKYKIGVFYCLLSLDLIFSSFFELQFASTLSGFDDTELIIVFVYLPLIPP